MSKTQGAKLLLLHIPQILVYRHLFPSICLFNISCDITYLSSDYCLFMQTLWCTTLSVQLVTVVDDFFGDHRWTRTSPIGPPRLNEQEDGSLRPSPLALMLLPK